MNLKIEDNLKMSKNKLTMKIWIKICVLQILVIFWKKKWMEEENSNDNADL